jgi:hypothetical protein
MTQSATVTTTTTKRKMSLTCVYSEKSDGPFRVLIYGPEKVGKSSWALHAPSPIFISGDNGLKYLKDPATGLAPKQFPVPETYADVVEAVNELTTEKHDYKTLVIDPINWIEPMIFAEFVRLHPKNDKGEVMREINDYGYFKGQVGAVDVWRDLLFKLEKLQDRRGLNVILVAHSQIKVAANPLGAEYEKYCLQLDGGAKSERAAGKLAQWPDAILFVNYASVIRKIKGKEKGVGTGTRVVYTQPCDAFHAGNRYGLPPQLPLDFSEFYAHLRGELLEETNTNLRTELTQLVAGSELEEPTAKFLVTNPNTEQLRVLLNRATLKLQPKDEEATP